jgi:hypothetical protein
MANRCVLRFVSFTVGILVALLVSVAQLQPAAAREMLPYGQGLLWKVEAKGRMPNYVFGTIHLSDIRVTTLPDPVRQALNEAENLSLEVDMGAWSLYETQMLQLPEGRPLSEVLGKTLFARVERHLGEAVGGRTALERMKPWVVLLSLTQTMSGASRRASGGALPLDLVLRSIALQRGILVFGLEEHEEQFAVFDRMPEADQVEMIRDALASRTDDVAPRMERMIQLYLARDLDGLYALSKSLWKKGRKEVIDAFYKRLIVDRNHVMARRMHDLLREGGAFVAVGAGHLAGEEGVLNLLARRGYGIERVY